MVNSSNRPRRVVVVLGMHRSGTSLLGRVLQALGVNFGHRLIEADSHNAGGYFEHPDIVRLNRQLLEGLDRRWTGAKGTLPYPPNWFQAPEAQAVKDRLIELIGREVEQSAGLWGFKDPRVSRLVPLWRQVFEAAAVEPLYLLAVRHPQAVAASVIKRDAISPARAQLLWLQHNLDALRETRGKLAGVVDYDRWFTHLPEQVRAVMAALDLPETADEEFSLAQIAQNVQPGLRHHRAVDQVCLPYVAETYQALAEAAAIGHIPERLWQIAEEVGRAQALLGAWSEVLDGMPKPSSRSAPVSPGKGTHSIYFRLLSAAKSRLRP